MTTLIPRPPYSDSELTALYPPDLRLQHVQILLRHGERTPVSARFANAGVPRFWPYCSAVRQFRSAVLDPDTTSSAGPGSSSASASSSASGSDSGSSSGNEGRVLSTFEWRRRLETFGPNDAPINSSSPRGDLDSICDPGMLTDRGRETTLDLGRRLRRLYVDQLGFLPASIKHTGFLYLRSTAMPRALESMQQAFLGLYPSHTRDPALPPPVVVSRAFSEETLVPNDGGCRRFGALARAFANRAAEKWNDSEEMAYLNKKIGRWMPDDSPRVAVDGHPRLSGIMDSINSTSAHGPDTRLPKEFYDPKLRQIIDKIGVEEWYAGYKESNEYRTLGIGGLLADVVARMVGSAEQSAVDGDHEAMNRPGKQIGPSPVRFGLSGCHDTTLASALTSLGAFDGESWPPFTSHIAIELFHHPEKPDVASATQSILSSTIPSPSSSSSSSWLPSFLGGRNSTTKPPGISRKQTNLLSEAEKKTIQGYYVRIRYNDKPVIIPGCKAAGKHFKDDDTFCTLEAFKSIVDKFSPHNWKEQCNANTKAPAFPPKSEPAGY